MKLGWLVLLVFVALLMAGVLILGATVRPEISGAAVLGAVGWGAVAVIAFVLASREMRLENKRREWRRAARVGPRFS